MNHFFVTLTIDSKDLILKMLTSSPDEFVHYM